MKHTFREILSKQRKIITALHVVTITFFALIFVFTVFVLYNYIYASRVFPNMYLGDENYASLSDSQAYTRIKEKTDLFLNTNFSIITGEQIQLVKPAELGLTIDNEATARNLYLSGRTGNVFNDIYFRLKSLVVKTKIEPTYLVDNQKFSLKVNSLVSPLDKKATDAKIEFIKGSVKITPEFTGEVVDQSKFTEDFKNEIVNLQPKPIKLVQIRVEPKVRKESLAQLKQKIEVLEGQQIVLTYGEDSWKLGGNTLFDMFKFYPTGYEDVNFINFDTGDFKPVVETFAIKDFELQTLSIALEADKINAYVLEIQRSIDRPSKDANLKFENGKVTEFTPAQDGQVLNREILMNKISNVLSVDTNVNDKNINIALPVTVTRAKIANNEINSLGIRELVGRGVSYYAHSIPNRAWNVALGTKRVSGTLVKPGEIFSFNKSVGEVSGATGYRQAYVISAGKTVLDDGGGICQVSTTVFRAALNAGLPIVSRTAHAYRVGYYEQNGTKPGFDATVFSPSVDFQFRNDMANSILVQAVVDERLARLEVDIYGTGDGRRVVLSDSTVSNQIPALPDKREDDPTLPIGQVKQVDFAAAGATAVFTRKVYKGDLLVLDDVFKSVYRPWAAVYLVGTKS